MNNKINYEIDNCTTDLDTLIALDKRAIRDLENNTHEIEQHEVLTIIREFIRLRNDYEQEKEKNNFLKKQVKLMQEYYKNADFIFKDKIKDKIKNRKENLENFYNSSSYGDRFVAEEIERTKCELDILKELLEEE